jgi:GTP cyclohydrolase I
MNQELIEQKFSEIMKDGLGLDLSDENYKETPKRVAKTYKEIFAGLENIDKDIDIILSKAFPSYYDGIVTIKNIKVYSMCPHHLLPVIYKVNVGVMYKDKMLGLSKIPRLVKLLAKRPMLQETFTQEIVEVLKDKLDVRGAICTVSGEHMCMQMRGIEQNGSCCFTSSVVGTFREQRDLELKFLEMIK